MTSFSLTQLVELHQLSTFFTNLPNQNFFGVPKNHSINK